MSDSRMSDSGPRLFARFAYPPNALGYCGPEDARALIEEVGSPADEGLRAAATRFEGAWPYLQLIAAANGIGDPLDPRVVEAYWIGNPLLDRVDTHLLGDALELRFRARAGRQWERLLAPVPAGARPHHNFHVFAVYPWLGLIRSAVVEQPLRTLDRCRIRWARVEAVLGDRVVVRGHPLEWDGRELRLGAIRTEEATVRADWRALATDLHVGDWCALHWDWVCMRLSTGQVARLQRWTSRTLTTVNAMSFPAPAAVLA